MLDIQGFSAYFSEIAGKYRKSREFLQKLKYLLEIKGNLRYQLVNVVDLLQIQLECYIVAGNAVELQENDGFGL